MDSPEAKTQPTAEELAKTMLTTEQRAQLAEIVRTFDGSAEELSRRVDQVLGITDEEK